VLNRLDSIVIFCVLAVLTACTPPELPPGKRGGAFLFVDPEKQEFVLSELERQGVPYKLDEKGMAHYMLKDQSVVHGLKRRAHYGEGLRSDVWESAVLVDGLTRNTYKDAFATAGIPHRIVEQDGVTQIEWNQMYGPRVDQLRQKMDESIMDQVIADAASP